MWAPSDGTSLKKFGANGTCSGVYYAGGKPLDIGGPMTCQLSQGQNSAGRYTLDVTQGPNESTYLLAFDSEDRVTVYSNSGARLYAMTRK